MVQVDGADRGLQPERTALAWSRTGLAIFVNAMIVLRAGAQSGQPLIVSLGIVLLAAAAGAVVCGVWRVRHLAEDGKRVAPPWILIVATAGIALLACFSGVAVVVAPLIWS